MEGYGRRLKQPKASLVAIFGKRKKKVESTKKKKREKSKIEEERV